MGREVGRIWVELKVHDKKILSEKNSKNVCVFRQSHRYPKLAL